MVEKFNAEAALRIGHAARQLDGLAIGKLMDILIRAAGYPLSCERLASLNTKKIISASRGQLNSSRQLTQALACLQGKFEIQGLHLPPPDPDAGNMPNSIRVAFASDYCDLVDSTFATASRFVIYQISPSKACLIAERSMNSSASFKVNMKNRISLLEDCQIIYSLEFGSRNIARLIEHGMHPISCQQVQSAAGLIGNLQAALKTPPPWLAKYTLNPEEQAERAHKIFAKIHYESEADLAASV